MDGSFSNVISSSARIAHASSVEKMREFSLEVIDLVLKEKGVCIVHGLRGVGKTTILSELSRRIPNSVYLSGDVILKYGVDFLEVLHSAFASGYSCFLIDEVHAIPNWEKDVKIFSDETRTKIVLSGSSAAALRSKGSELSRRASLFEVKPLSFREFISFKTGKEILKVSIEQIIAIQSRRELMSQLMPFVNLYESYVKNFGLPASFFEEKQNTYLNILERIVRYDLESLREIDVHYISAVFKIVKLIATSQPGEISYSKISNGIQRSVKFTQEAVNLLSIAGVVNLVPPEGIGNKLVRSEDKMLLPLSFRASLCKAYGVEPSIGGLREDFFAQHVPGLKYLKTGTERRTPDFKFGELIFEVGGDGKRTGQIQGMKNAFLVKESISITEKEIPIYLFGLLY